METVLHVNMSLLLYSLVFIFLIGVLLSVSISYFTTSLLSLDLLWIINDLVPVVCAARTMLTYNTPLRDRENEKGKRAVQCKRSFTPPIVISYFLDSPHTVLEERQIDCFF